MPRWLGSLVRVIGRPRVQSADSQTGVASPTAGVSFPSRPGTDAKPKPGPAGAPQVSAASLHQ